MTKQGTARYAVTARGQTRSQLLHNMRTTKFRGVPAPERVGDSRRGVGAAGGLSTEPPHTFSCSRNNGLDQSPKSQQILDFDEVMGEGCAGDCAAVGNGRKRTLGRNDDVPSQSQP